MSGPIIYRQILDEQTTNLEILDEASILVRTSLPQPVQFSILIKINGIIKRINVLRRSIGNFRGANVGYGVEQNQTVVKAHLKVRLTSAVPLPRLSSSAPHLIRASPPSRLTSSARHLLRASPPPRDTSFAAHLLRATPPPRDTSFAPHLLRATPPSQLTSFARHLLRATPPSRLTSSARHLLRASPPPRDTSARNLCAPHLRHTSARNLYARHLRHTSASLLSFVRVEKPLRLLLFRVSTSSSNPTLDEFHLDKLVFDDDLSEHSSEENVDGDDENDDEDLEMAEKVANGIISLRIFLWGKRK
ncbi:hypothetical protein Fmac_027477 [Flemingia macrophylla]|uniref:Uncharacterized protein n=1 Tax=Flemingia macrophylla TaxID=520843 RepID=A0ABD1LHT7_9FABA